VGTASRTHLVNLVGLVASAAGVGWAVSREARVRTASGGARTRTGRENGSAGPVLPPRPAQKQVAAILAGLSVDPWPPGFKPLVGAPGMLRVRSGSYRVIYQVAHRSKLLVMVVWVGNRRDAYRHLRR